MVCRKECVFLQAAAILKTAFQAAKVRNCPKADRRRLILAEMGVGGEANPETGFGVPGWGPYIDLFGQTSGTGFLLPNHTRHCAVAGEQF